MQRAEINKRAERSGSVDRRELQEGRSGGVSGTCLNSGLGGGWWAVPRAGRDMQDEITVRADGGALA